MRCANHLKPFLSSAKFFQFLAIAVIRIPSLQYLFSPLMEHIQNSPLNGLRFPLNMNGILVDGLPGVHDVLAADGHVVDALSLSFGVGAGLADYLDDVVDDLLGLELVHGSGEGDVPDLVVDRGLVF